ncbi:prepilin-type N-terminal cleavage/methylation domain-containing protein [Endozoicomonas sp. Mp262]|uniref:type IV pilin protein n=1 Tax=Endozoicomonas sp. Mp262 TaxID=2919499 RepID=UPI0021DA99A8
MKNKNSGMTIVEIFIVLAIVGILIGIGYPNYIRYVTESRRTDAMAFMLEAMQRQERYFTENLEYTTQLTKLGYGSDAMITEGEAYSVRAAACLTGVTGPCVRLVATPRGIQHSRDNGLELTVDSRGRRTGIWND